MQTGKYPEARAYLERALAIAQSKLGASHVTTSAITVNLADISAHENKWPDALSMLRRASGQMAGATEPGKRLGDLDARTNPRDLECFGWTSGRQPQERGFCRGAAPARNPGRRRARADVGAVCRRQ